MINLRLLLLISILILFLQCPIIYASNFGLNGTWTMNANGWKFALEITENGNHFEGVMKPSNHNAAITKVSGTTYPDGKIVFKRYLNQATFQSYEGRIFQGIEKSQSIAGLFADTDNVYNFGWFAEKTSNNIASQHQAIRLFTNVPKQNSALFKANVFPELSVGTINGDKTPYHMTTQFLGLISISPGQRCYLAGNPQGTSEWSIDNFLLFEICTESDVNRFYIGQAEPLYYQGQLLKQVGFNSVNFKPEQIDLTPYLPQNTTFKLVVSALDYGNVGYVSDLYLIIK